MKWLSSLMFRGVEKDLMAVSFYLETYGCSLNSADSDVIIGRLKAVGAQQVDTVNDADVIILNTCGVKEPTEDRIIHRLEKLGTGPTPVIIAGCLPKISLPRIEHAIPDYAAILGPQATESVADVVERVLSGERSILHLESTDRSKLRWLEAPNKSVVCTVPICEGCLGSCTYCAVRFARGQVRSHPEKEIRRTIEECVRAGYREIRITSQDLGVYGADIDSSLVSLLKEIDKIEGPHKFRLGMFNPNLVLGSINKILDVMKSEHFFKFFHVPLQSGSDSILAAMGRQYHLEEWEYIVKTIAKTFKDVTIATDIIVGFPGETEDDFEQTMDVIQRIRPHLVNISKYGDRPNTLASKARNKVETGLKKQRSRQLTTLVNKILFEHNQSWVGWSGPAIVTERGSKSGLLCRSLSYRPIIIHEDLQLGVSIDLKVTGVKRTQLIGRTISSV
jgi:threonylcarbamoyladenosine tRNA methylthiotransferase CDKAL1